MLWYVAYGSNLNPDRFAYYLNGGAPEGAALPVGGARDPSPAVEERPVTVPGAMFFAGESPNWTGGISFFDGAAVGACLGRAYLITDQQFADVAAQEMHREAADDLDLSQVLANGSHSYGPGLYETVHLVGRLDGYPMLTFTAPDPSALTLNAPSPAYLRTIAAGLGQTHQLNPPAIVDYLSSRRGAGAWTRRRLDELLT